MKREGADELPVKPLRHGALDPASYNDEAKSESAQARFEDFDFESYSLKAVYFDKNDSLAGFEWSDFSWLEPVKKTMISNQKVSLKASQIDPSFTNYEFETNSRLVGFRTTKDSVGSKLIKSVQPFYFSVDEKICKRSLAPITVEQARLERNEFFSRQAALIS